MSMYDVGMNENIKIAKMVRFEGDIRKPYCPYRMAGTLPDEVAYVDVIVGRSKRENHYQLGKYE